MLNPYALWLVSSEGTGHCVILVLPCLSLIPGASPGNSLTHPASLVIDQSPEFRIFVFASSFKLTSARILAGAFASNMLDEYSMLLHGLDEYSMLLHGFTWGHGHAKYIFRRIFEVKLCTFHAEYAWPWLLCSVWVGCISSGVQPQPASHCRIPCFC